MVTKAIDFICVFSLLASIAMRILARFEAYCLFEISLGVLAVEVTCKSSEYLI